LLLLNYSILDNGAAGEKTFFPWITSV